MRAKIWDLDGWDSPVTVAGLNPERQRGYFPLALGLGEVVCDLAGDLYVKASLMLRPNDGGIHSDWLCEVQYVPGGGIALHVPKAAYRNVRVESGKLAGYLPVSEVF